MLRSKIDDASAYNQIIEYIYILKALEFDRDYEKVEYIVSELICLQSKFQNSSMKIDICDYSGLIKVHHEVNTLIQELIEFQLNITNHLVMMKKNKYGITSYMKNKR